MSTLARSGRRYRFQHGFIGPMNKMTQDGTVTTARAPPPFPDYTGQCNQVWRIVSRKGRLRGLADVGSQMYSGMVAYTTL